MENLNPTRKFPEPQHEPGQPSPLKLVALKGTLTVALV